MIPEVGLLYTLQQIKWTLFPDWLFEFNRWDVHTISVRHLAELTVHDPALRWATNQDIDAMKACGIREDVLDRCFPKNLRIALYEKNGRIIGYGQYTVGSWHQSDWLNFQLSPTDFLGAGNWVDPDFRGQRIAAKIMAFAWSQLARDGYWRMVNIVNALNHNSKRAIAKVGQGSIEPFWYCRCLGFSYYHYQERHGFGCWSKRNRLALSLGCQA